ncbi:DUF2000 family protein [Pseudomonas sp. Pseusp122]|uniref:DUF2000 family protein n=1 Tax=unclassified Pseudomonas TaxID=196821 RepID=UPI0039A6FE29
MLDQESPAPSEKYKIAVVLREDLLLWQQFNVTAFVISGVCSEPGVHGAPYVDASGQQYLPMFREPVLTFSSSLEGLRRIADRARLRNVKTSIFTDELFSTYTDEDNRNAVSLYSSDALNIAGMAFRCPRNTADKLLKGYRLMA